jgi:hypothetical protein
MATKSVAANAFRWAAPTIERLIHYQPSSSLDFLRAGPATKHYVALAVRGWEVTHDRSDAVLHRLALELFSHPRTTVLAQMWGQRFGKLALLRRLPGRVLPRSTYDRLVTAMANPHTRRLLAQAAHISAAEIEVISLFDNPRDAAASLCKAAQIGPVLFNYALTAVRRHRPDLVDAELSAVLRHLGRTKTLSGWLCAVLAKAELPRPPWPGTAMIVPLDTVAAIRAAGRELRNCLAEHEHWLAALFGQRCYYRVDGRNGPAIVALEFDALLGTWRLECWHGPGNAALKPAAARHIRMAFAAAGIRYFGQWPRSRLFERGDPLRTLW